MLVEDLEAFRGSRRLLVTATQALAEPEDARATPQQMRYDKRRIKELERDLRRKDKALAETTALLVLSKELEAIFNKGEDESVSACACAGRGADGR